MHWSWPYANLPAYALEQDYHKFKRFLKRGVACYLQTGHFLDRKIPKEVP